MDLRLTGKAAVVMGASRGIGRAIAEGLAAEGVHLAICARSEVGLATVSADLEARGVRVYTRALDVADTAALQSFIADAADALGRLDILVSNQSAEHEGWEANFEVDLMAAVHAVETATPLLERDGGGSIVFVSSVAAVEGWGESSYGPLKAALIAYSGNLGRALAPRGIRANVISPGATLTEGSWWATLEAENPEEFAAAVATIPRGRMGAPEEVANAVVFLASPAASLITGANLVADGGWSRRVNF